jgi:hypothetical protein
MLLKLDITNKKNTTIIGEYLRKVLNTRGDILCSHQKTSERRETGVKIKSEC